MTKIIRRSFLFLNFLFLLGLEVYSQKSEKDFKTYRAVFHRPDGNEIPFNMLVSTTGEKPVWIISNAGERLELKNISRVGDTLIALFPVFESQFHLSVKQQDAWKGFWYKGAAAGLNTQALSVYPNQDFRFIANPKKTRHTISGRWAVTFTRENNTTRPAVAEFVQEGNKLTGTFLNSSGDYRYLEGIVSGDSLMLSTFDGSHAYSFRAVIDNNQQISGGLFLSGTAHKEKWSAVKNANAKLPDDPAVLAIREHGERLNFSFPDLDGKMVSITDEKFRNKVVIIQLMGSWCANCMDETAFISDYYKKNNSRGIEIIALAYEYSTDPARSKKSIQKFRDRFDIKYPLLITGVTSTDSLKTEKTLPQLKNIESFPTTIFIDKSGAVRKIHTGFSGPATGVHYEEEKKNFSNTVEELLNYMHSRRANRVVRLRSPLILSEVEGLCSLCATIFYA